MKNITSHFYSIFYFLVLSLISLMHGAHASVDGIMENFPVIALDGSSSNAKIKGLVQQSENKRQAVTYEDDEPLDIILSITIDPDDVGFDSELYIAARYNNKSYYKDSSGQWQSLAENLSNLGANTKKRLQPTESLTITSNQLLASGEYLIFVGYLNRQGKIVYNQQPLNFIVFSSSKAKLHQFQYEDVLKTYFKKAFKNQLISTPGDIFSGVSSSGGSSINVSSTNLQELGVDEADTIKTNGKQLYTLDTCQSSENISDSSSSDINVCLSAYQINESPASNQLLSQYQFASETTSGAFYLANIGNDNGTKEMAIRIAGSRSFSGWQWSYPGYWTETITEINMIDITDPEVMLMSQTIKLDGNLISSRRIGNMLYLVTRMTPIIEGYRDWYPDEPVEGWDITQEQIDTNQQLLDNLSLNDIIPAITLGDKEPVPLHQVQDCFLPAHTSNKLAERSIISVTSIPLDDPDSYHSQCIIGTTETFYASTQTIYLASSRYQYNLQTLDYSVADRSERYRTELHKFSISEEGLEYKGSGEVPGHLGWSMDKKPFRMGEYNNELRVATSLGSSWDQESTTSLTILKEAADGTRLEKIGGIDGLGKPGESLFAARFVGKRGYLVTFKQTDPLYVLDLEDGANPQVMAELEIDGFSDYLHPIGDTHLLGIGKQAIPAVDEQGNDRGFSWIQGVKLSLFDVTDANSVKEIQSMEIGKRPTQSAVLNDHHAFSFLDAHNGSPARFAFPVDLYDTIPEYNSSFDLLSPSTYYDWTYTGLYVFNLEIDIEPSFNLAGKLITAERIPLYYYQGPRSGRSVIQGDTVHYFFNHELYSRAISELD